MRMISLFPRMVEHECNQGGVCHEPSSNFDSKDFQPHRSRYFRGGLLEGAGKQVDFRSRTLNQLIYEW